jgi:transposase
MDAFIGIDVAKDTLAVALVGPANPRRLTVDNTPAGHQRLLAWLTKQHLTVVRVCLEATGIYSDEIAQTLHDAGYQVSVVNPARIAAYAQSQLQRNKTDAVDAVLIATFAQREQPDPWVPLDPAIRALRALLRHREALIAQRLAEQQRRQLAATHPAAVTAALDAHLAFLDDQIATIDQHIRDHLDQHPDLRRDHALLTSIPGIGAQTAACILAETGGLERYPDGAAVTAYAGLTPRQYRSGTSVHRKTRLAKVGNAWLRRALYMPAIVARHHNPVLRAFADRLAERGLAPKAVIGAVMRKLLILAFGVVKSGQPFDPAYRTAGAGAG